VRGKSQHGISDVVNGKLAGKNLVVAQHAAVMSVSWHISVGASLSIVKQLLISTQIPTATPGPAGSWNAGQGFQIG
jgi:hypothetical protein